MTHNGHSEGASIYVNFPLRHHRRVTQQNLGFARSLSARNSATSACTSIETYWNYAWCEISRLDNMTISSHGGRSKCADACWCKSLCWEIASCQPLNLHIHACHTSSIQQQGIGPWKYAEHWSNPSRTFRLELEAVLQLGTTIIDLVIAWQWRRIKIWGATNARQNLAISLTLGILHSGQICFFHLFPFSKEDSGTTLSAKLPAVCATQNHIKSIYPTFLGGDGPPTPKIIKNIILRYWYIHDFKLAKADGVKIINLN